MWIKKTEFKDWYWSSNFKCKYDGKQESSRTFSRQDRTIGINATAIFSHFNGKIMGTLCHSGTVHKLIV